MTREEVIPGVVSAIKRALESEADFQFSSALRADLNMDSIGFVELCTTLENSFNIDIDESTYDLLVTVEDVIELVLTSPKYEAV